MSSPTVHLPTADFLKGLDHEVPRAKLPPQIFGVTSDSRAVAAGFAFVAVKGVSQDGHKFIESADAAGAALIVGEIEAPAKLRAPYLRVKDSHLALARLAANFHGNPSHSMVMVGITGTSGKTTTTYLVESVLRAAGHKTGLIGTVTFRIGGPEGKALPSTHTTPGAVELQELLARMKAEGCTAVAMEVSSHALKQERTDVIAFDAMVFTNLSREHLDFHPDMEDYYRAKLRLFSDYVAYSREAGKSPVASVNADDEYGQRLARDARMPVLKYGLSASADVSGAKVVNDLSGTRGESAGVKVDSALSGKFNVLNLLAALAVGKGLKLPDDAIARGLHDVPVVPGRLERVPNRAGIHVLVDYAHKPDALEKVLQALQDARKTHRILTVFGCGGDRDRTKRPVMGRIALALSDRVWITSDNPRTENPDAIIEEILKGLPPDAHHYSVEADRKKAIHAAVAAATPGDVVLIAGKGHEDYQILADPKSPGKTYKIHFDDREVAAEALEARS